MKRVALLSTALIIIPTITQAQCVATTDCASLGYTKTSCPNGGLKCPFANYWSCKETTSIPTEPETPTTAILGKCTGYAKNCNIGDILNSNGTCIRYPEDCYQGHCPYEKLPEGSPIGIVITIKDNCGWAMTLNQIATVPWSEYGTDIPGLPSSTTAFMDFDVSGNMTKIIQAGNATAYPAAYAALNYAPSAALTSKGKWALPTAGILNNLYSNLDEINSNIIKLKGTEAMQNNEHIWSSTVVDKNSAWGLITDDSNTTGGQTGVIGLWKMNYHVVRPVIEF